MSEEEPPIDSGSGGGDGGGEGGGQKCNGCGKKGKRVSLFGFRKAKKVQYRPNRRRRKEEAERGGSMNTGCWAKRAFRNGNGGGCLKCFKQPTTLDSSGESPTSDPNSSDFTYDMLRTLIEKNDFYSKECNPHLLD